MTTKIMKIVRIEWSDSSRTAGWHRPGQYNDTLDLKCTSIGVIVDRGKDHVTIASNFAWQVGKGYDVCDTMTIPRSAITKTVPIAEMRDPNHRGDDDE